MNEKESSWVRNSNRRLKLANVVSIKNRWSSRTKTFYIKSWKYFQFFQSLLEIIEYQELNSQCTFLRAQSLNILKPFAVLNFNFLIYAVKDWRTGPSYTPTSSVLKPKFKKVCAYLPVEAMLPLSKVRTHSPTTHQIRVSLQQGISADTVQPKLSIHTAPEHGQVVLVSTGAESTFWGGPDNTPPIRQTPKGRERLRGSYRWATKDISIVVDGPRDSLKSCGTDDILSLSSVRQQGNGKM